MLQEHRTLDTYWDWVGRIWSDRQLSPWRQFTDCQQLALIHNWLALPLDSPFKLLKTDLFDEVAHRGLVKVLLQYGMEVTGIDVSPVIVNQAVARNPGLNGVLADVRQLPFAAELFDAVFSGSTLDHLESSAGIVAALEELGRVLKPGGRLILTMDNPENPLIRLRNGPLLGLLLRLGIVPHHGPWTTVGGDAGGWFQHPQHSAAHALPARGRCVAGPAHQPSPWLVPAGLPAAAAQLGTAGPVAEPLADGLLHCRSG
jgi:SAM-dependent methyltransferase